MLVLTHFPLGRRGVLALFLASQVDGRIAVGYALSIWVHLIFNRRLEGILPDQSQLDQPVVDSPVQPGLQIS